VAEPELTAVTVGLNGEPSLRATLGALAVQTVADRLEVVAVIPSGAAAPSSDSFAAMRTVRVSEMTTTGAAIAAGVHAASAPIVAYTEEHSWPRPDWAERLLDAHDGRPEAVSWSLENANPDTATSWVHLLSDFGPAVHPTPSRPLSTPPWHHTSYRRELLVGYGPELANMLEAEWRVHADLAGAGHLLLHSGEARSRHWNVSPYLAHLVTEFRGAQSFGASRVEHGSWGLGRRVAYVAATPLLLAVRLRRVAADLRRVHPPRTALVGGLLVVSFTTAAVAEACGYALGRGSSRHRRMLLELDRRGGLGRADRGRWDREVELYAARTGSTSNPRA
jgi:hypothetical protein